MKQEGLSAVVIPSTDPHNSEYVPARWKSRQWISGFDGSAGTVVVTLGSAALWTDSRYFIQAADQLSGTGIVLMKQRVPGTPSVAQWIARETTGQGRVEVAVDGSSCMFGYVKSLQHELRKEGGITLRTNIDAVGRIWKGRPGIPSNPVVVHPCEFAGEGVPSKLDRIRTALRGKKADGMLVSELDDIAWTLNLRGSDVDCNPVFVAYLLISSISATLFVDGGKLTDGALAQLASSGVSVEGYEDVVKALAAWGEYNLLLDPDSTAYSVFKAAKNVRVVEETSPIPQLKAVKNSREIEGFRRAMLRDGVAVSRLLAWISKEVAVGGLTELGVLRKIEELRTSFGQYKYPSFSTISAYGEHGAIVHYEPTTETDAKLLPKGFILIDTGGQYEDGTTDVTRTLALGELSHKERLAYTLVLKGHIQLELLKFPRGACGTQLDAVARKDMWKHGFNYMHGTGHGVGAFLNVHEGPHQIRMEYVPQPLLPGMTVTDEPGLYFEGEFGVRIENTLLIRECDDMDGFLEFDTLTLCPIDTTPVIKDMLTLEEVDWINTYHSRVWSELSPLMDGGDRAWLRQATQHI